MSDCCRIEHDGSERRVDFPRSAENQLICIHLFNASDISSKQMKSSMDPLQPDESPPLMRLLMIRCSIQGPNKVDDTGPITVKKSHLGEEGNAFNYGDAANEDAFLLVFWWR